MATLKVLVCFHFTSHCVHRAIWASVSAFTGLTLIIGLYGFLLLFVVFEREALPPWYS